MQTDVVSEPVLPDASIGDTSEHGDVGGEATPKTAAEQRMVPQKDLDKLRSTYDKQLAQTRRELEELRQWREQQSLQASMSTKQQELFGTYYQGYLAQGYDDATARQWAQHYAVEDAKAQVEQQQKLQTTEQRLKTYEEQEAQRAFEDEMQQLHDDICGDLGLTTDELIEAKGSLKADDPKFEAKLWKSATAFARQKEQRAPSRQAQEKRNATPFLTGGAGDRQYQPIALGDFGKPETTQFLQQAKLERRRRPGE